MGRISSELTHWTSTARHGGFRRGARTLTSHTFHRDPNFPEERPEVPTQPPSIPTWGPPSSLNIFDLSFWAPLAPPLELLGKCGQNRGFTQKFAEYGWDSEVTCQFQRKGDAFFPSSCFNVLFQGSQHNTILRTNTLNPKVFGCLKKFKDNLFAY